MPAMASLTVKKADETTNIVYDALVASPGDNGSALWRQDTGAVAGLPVGMRATLTMSTTWNGPRTARRAVITYKRPYPVLNSSTGRYESVDAAVMRLEFTMPQGLPATEANESAYQAMNCIGLASGLIKQCLAAGYAPT
jgi:hypothetical protein